MTEWGKALRPTVHDLVKEINNTNISIDEFKEQTNQNIANINEDIDEFKEQTNQNIANINEDIDELQGDVETLQTDKANKAGYYENLVAGAADTLFGSDTETETFTQRVSGADGMLRIESLQGNTIVQDNELINVNIEDIKSVGFNQWDEQTKLGFRNATTGAYETSNEQFCSVNPIPVFPSTDYYIKTPSTLRVLFYDSDMGFISAVNRGDAVVQSPSTARFMHINTFESPAYPSGTTYNHDICINISNPNRNGEYEAYWSEQREIPVETYFPDGMRSAGNVRDELTATQAVTRVGVVDLGTLTWTYNTGTSVFYGTVPDKAKNANGAYGQTCADGYTLDAVAIADMSNMTYRGLFDDNRVVFKNTAYTDAAAFKAAMNGVMLYYELATPTTTEIDPPLNMSYRTQQDGTESIVIPDGENSAPPVFVTTQAVNADGVADMALAQIAVIENGNANANYNVGDYLIHNGILYRVTQAIANGETIIVGTNVTATTVMDELVRLTS